MAIGIEEQVGHYLVSQGHILTEVTMRFVLIAGALLIGLSLPAFAQQASSNDTAQKAPSLQSGTNAQSDVSSPGSNEAVPYRDTTGTMSSEKPRAPSLQAGTNAEQSKDRDRDPVQSGTHGSGSRQ